MPETIEYGRRSVAGNFVVSVAGDTSLARGLLRFDLTCTVYAGVDADRVIIIPVGGRVGDGRVHLASLYPVSTQLSSARADSERMPMTFQTELGFDQLRLLDEQRETDGTRCLSATFRFLVDGASGMNTAIATFHPRLTDEQWRRVLAAMSFEERATFDVPVLGGQVGPPYDAAAKFLRDAIQQRDLGHHPQAVAAAREVFDSIGSTGVPLPPARHRADWHNRSAREAWDIENRISFIREAVDHATNVGHHRVIGDPTPKQSRLLVAMTALLLKYYSAP